MLAYLFKLSLKLLNNKLRNVLIILQFGLLFAIFNVVAYDLWSETMQSKRVIDSIGTETTIVDVVSSHLSGGAPPMAVESGGVAGSWTKGQLDYLRNTYHDRFIYYYSYLARQTTDNDPSLHVLYVERTLYERIAALMLKKDASPYFHTRHAKPPLQAAVDGRQIALAADSALLDRAVVDYLTARPHVDYVIFPADELPDLALIDLSVLFAAALTNEAKTEVIAALNAMNPEYSYSFRRLADFPESNYTLNTGSMKLRLLFAVVSFVMMFIGFMGTILILYFNHYGNLKTLRLFGASPRHVHTILVAWNAILLLPGFLLSLPASYLIIRRGFGDDFIVSFLQFPVYLTVALIALGSLPLMFQYHRNRNLIGKG